MIKNKIINFDVKIFNKNAIYIILIILYVILFTFQINLYPVERYPNWDHFFGDCKIAGDLITIRHAFTDFELPAITPYVGFGHNFAGNGVLSTSFLSPFNLLVMLFPPTVVLALRTMAFLGLGAVGAYLFLKMITKETLISFLGGLTYISLPFIISTPYYWNSLNGLLLIPLSLVLLHKLIGQDTPRNLLFFVLLSVFAFASGGIYFPILFPIVVSWYSFVVAYCYYKIGLARALKKAFGLTFLVVLCGAFYIVPLFNNLWTISATLRGYLGASSSNFLKIVSFGNQPFSLSRFYELGLSSLYMPVEGSGLLLYVPIFFYVTLVISLLLRNTVFREEPRQRMILLALLPLGLIVFLLNVVAGGNDYRGLLNLIPFVNVLAGFVCLSAISRVRNQKMQLYGLIITISLLVDLVLFTLPGSPIPETTWKAALFESSNRIKICFVHDMWRFLPWLNMLFVVLIVVQGRWRTMADGYLKRWLFIGLVGCTGAVPLLNISAHNQLRLQQKNWQLLSRDAYRVKSYLKRKECIDGMIDRYDINYRTLYAGRGRMRSNTGRDYMLIAETELHVQKREKVLFSHRLDQHPYVNLMHGTFNGTFLFKARYPPLSGDVSTNIDTMKLMGIKWVISADKRIDNPNLVYRGECRSERGVYSKNEGGRLFVYELVNPTGIAFLVDHYEKVSLHDSVRAIHEKKEVPWLKSVVYLETDPVSNLLVGNRESGDESLANRAEITKETVNSVRVDVSAPEGKYLVLSYIYRPNWRAYIDGTVSRVYKAYGGFMAVKVPAGNHTVIFRYTPMDVYLGLSLTVLAFFMPLVGCFLRPFGEKRRICS